MATLNEEQFNVMNTLLFKPEDADPNAVAAIENDPELRQEMERLVQEFVAERGQKQLQQTQRALFSGGTATFDSVISGAQDSMYGVATFGLDILRAVSPDDSAFNESMTEARTSVNNQRAAMEEAHRVRRAETLGEQDPIMEFVTGSAPEFGGEILPFVINPQAATNTLPRLMAWNGLVGGVATTAIDKDAENYSTK